MKFWQALSFTETDQLVGLARICEEVGFHGAFVSDHLFHPVRLESRYPYSEDGVPPFDASTEWPESFAAISAMGAVTSRLHFTTSVYIATLRHPLVVAKAVATADAFAPGRVALGAGVGWIREEYELLGEGFTDRGRQHARRSAGHRRSAARRAQPRRRQRRIRDHRRADRRAGPRRLPPGRGCRRHGAGELPPGLRPRAGLEPRGKRAALEQYAEAFIVPSR